MVGMNDEGGLYVSGPNPDPGNDFAVARSTMENVQQELPTADETLAAVLRPSEESPLRYARRWLRERVEDGERCPCCNQYAKVYKRTIHATMARDLIVIYQKVGRKWFHLPDFVGHPGDFAKLRYWNLIHERMEPREDGGRAGWWRISDVGLHWVYDAITVPKYAHIYDGRCLRHSGAQIGVQHALGTKFDYRELMNI